jgi:uncharacterized FlaG/YvyC family protein
MDITGINRNINGAQAISATAHPVDRPADAREIVEAVKALNAVEMFGPENELLFQRDARTQRMVIRLVNRKTREVVNQVPAEYVLRLAEDRKNAVP